MVTAGFRKVFFFDSKHFFGTKAAKSSTSRLLLFQGRACSVHWSFSAHRGENLSVSHRKRHEPSFAVFSLSQKRVIDHKLFSITQHIFFKNIDMKKVIEIHKDLYTKVEIFLPYISSWLLSDFCCWGIQLYNCDCVVRWLQHPIASNFGIERWKMERCFPWRLKRILKKSQDEFWSSYIIHSLKLTANAPENKQFPKRKRERIPSLYFQGQAATLVSGRIHIHVQLLITGGLFFINMSTDSGASPIPKPGMI